MWIYAAFQFGLVILFSHLFYSVVILQLFKVNLLIKWLFFKFSYFGVLDCIEDEHDVLEI